MTAKTLARTRPRPFASRIADLPSRFRPDPWDTRRVHVHVATTGPEPGNWLIAVDGSKCAVFKGSLPTSEARVYTDSEIGVAVLDGVMSLRNAVDSRLVDFDGDVAVLRYLARSFGLDGRA